jgi:hypothetical protein
MSKAQAITSIVVDVLHAIGEGIRRRRQRRQEARRDDVGTLGDYGPLRATEARQRAHERARERGDL